VARAGRLGSGGALLAAGLLLVASACGKSSTSTGTGRPTPTAPGTPIGPPATQPIGSSGGTLTSPDGQLTLTVPPGAVPGSTSLTIQPITNLAPGGVGNAYRLQPEGTNFSKPVTLTFKADQALAAGHAIEQLTVSTQEGKGYWLRVPAATVTRDAAAKTVSAATQHFSDWALVTGPTAKDLTGTFVLESTLDGPYAGYPVKETGTATFTYAGEDPGVTYYLLAGTITLTSPVVAGAITCTPTSPATLELGTTVAEARPASGRFDWGFSGHWDITCSNGTTSRVLTAFDTAGIAHASCSGAYVGTPLVSATREQGTYAVTCGASGYSKASWDFATVAAVSGTRNATWWTDAAASRVTAAAPDVAPPAAPVAVRAWVPDVTGAWLPPSEGTFTAPATPTDLGVFTIPVVPSRPYVLELVDGKGVRHFVDATAAVGLDLGYDVQGRRSAVAASGATPVTLSLSGLAPWNAADQLQVTSSNAGVWDVLVPSPAIADLATSADVIENWGAANAVAGPLNLLAYDALDPAKNDLLYVHQLAVRSDAASGLSYQAASTGGSIAQVNLADLTPVTLPSTPPLALTALNLDPLLTPAPGALAGGLWSLSAFEAYLPRMSSPAATGGVHALTVGASAAPVLTPAPVPRGNPTLLALRLPQGATPDPTLGTLYYGQFLDPALWIEWRGLELSGLVSYTAPVLPAPAPLAVAVSMGRREAMLPAPTSALAPTLTPVEAPTITAGTPATPQNALGAAALAGTGTTPTFAWSPPIVGAPTRYTVDVYRLEAPAGATTATLVATWVTTGTRFSLPPGVLAAGSTYFARITAWSIPGDNPGAAPFRAVTASAWAGALTRPFSP
jgi:hypothetical protein